MEKGEIKILNQPYKMKRTTLYFSAIAALTMALAFGCKKDDKAAPSASGNGTPCSYTLGPWSAWADGIRTRTVSATPDGCTGTMPSTTEEHPCRTQNKGWLKIVNYSSNPYEVTITGPTNIPVFTLQGGYQQDSIYVGVGTYGIHSLQLAGYVLYPSEFNTTKAVPRCGVVSWSFP